MDAQAQVWSDCGAGRQTKACLKPFRNMVEVAVTLHKLNPCCQRPGTEHCLLDPNSKVAWCNAS
jgi:hypothetical protein